MEKWYEERVEKVLEEVKRILMGETTKSQDVEIVITARVGEPWYITYEVEGKVVM